MHGEAELGNILGSIGVTILLAAYVLNVTGRIGNESATYAALNILGAGITGYSSWVIGFIPFVVLEVVWALVALFALIRAMRA